MKTEQEINDALFQIKLQDEQCSAKAHELGTPCLSFGHAIYGTWTAVLRWVLGEGSKPW